MKFALPLLVCSVLFLTWSCSPDSVEEKKEITIDVPDGFVLDDLYTPSDHNRGSWVSLAQGPDSTLFACDQYGHIYQMPMPGADEPLDTNEIKKLRFPLGQANGLLWAHNSLYVVVNGSLNENYLGSGIYRLTDKDGDGDLDKLNILLELDGGGEHGPHSLLLGPDKETLYFLAGNHTKIPEKINKSRLPMNWAEDNLFPQYKDARGHASEIEAPGGWIATMDSVAQNIEIFSAGYRNPYDIAFNEAGDLFTFDADMEWDLGMPWYRPVRVCHVTSGSEYGWRTGSGKWPVYYPDNLSPVINLGQGSPTGIFMGSGLKFPQKYHNGLFVMDWSFGTIYYVNLEATGSTFKGSEEAFLTGTPLPLTDAIVGADGHLYFATGGRRLESHLYRLRYVGNEAISPATVPQKQGDAATFTALRKELEQYHKPLQTSAIPKAWTHLDHEDRFVRYAARLVLEHQPTSSWFGQYMLEQSSSKIIPASLALARSDEAKYLDAVLKKLLAIDWDALEEAQQINLLRAYGLTMMRLGKPTVDLQNLVIEQLRPHLPSQSKNLNKELSRLLHFLGDPTVTEKTVAMLEAATNAPRDTALYLSDDVTDRSEQYGPAIKEMLANMPPAEAIYHAITLSYTQSGWTPELRTNYFNWFYDVFNSKGGMSFKGFMDKVRLKALDNVPEEEREKYLEMSGIFSPGDQLADLPQPEGPGKSYAFREINRIVGEGLRDYQGDVATGKRIYEAALCGACHRIRGEGGNAGPDLTQIHTRFSRWELIYAIYTPNEEISDQYAYNLYTLEDGSKRAGRLVSEDDNTITIQPNAYDQTQTLDIPKAKVVKTALSPISPMPPGLLNRLNEEELVDLMAYILSGGDPSHKFYTGAEK